jgi:putative aminopeptidase FrvX
VKPWLCCLLLLSPVSLSAQTPAQVRAAEHLLSALVESHGVSGMERPVRDMVKRFLPAWAGARVQTDTAGNLWLTVGQGEPTVVFVAHLDEVGFTVRTLRDDGLLEVEPAGGFFPWLWQGRPALVHTDSTDIPGVFLPRDPSTSDSAPASRVLVDIGSGTRDSTNALGIRPGHTVTSPKSYARLAGTRATGRSFDDRVGSTALLLAVRQLDPQRLRHTVVFIWSVREEIGLEGAEAAAHALGLRPVRVHAIDTFVSADAPLENPRFALAPLSRGPVARAVDNSAVTPPAVLDSLAALARTHRIPLQVGSTNGGNDGSAFAPYGVPDVAIGWPLRYSHSPAEVADLMDVVNLGRLVRAIAQDW